MLGALEPQEAEMLRSLLVKVALSVDSAEPCVTATDPAAGGPSAG